MLALLLRFLLFMLFFDVVAIRLFDSSRDTTFPQAQGGCTTSQPFFVTWLCISAHVVLRGRLFGLGP